MPLPNPNYTINFTDPTKTPFILPAFRTDGPTAPSTPTLDIDATAAHTSLLLYGKGHPNYGSRTDQNLVNMIEHFANNVRPAFPIQGQIWFKNASFLDPSNPTDPTIAGLYVFSPRDFPILSASNSTNTFVVAGNQVASFPIGNTFVVTGTVANDGIYNVISAVFTAFTTITVLSVPAVQGAGGNIQASIWNTISLSGAPVGDLDMGGFKIINLGSPTLGTDATNKNYVDAQDALHVLKAGDTMSGLLVFSGTAGIQFTGTGQIDMGLNKIINLGTPTLNTDATTKTYVDSQDALHVLKAGDTMSGILNMTGNKITNLGNATVATDALNMATGDSRYLQLTGGTITGIVNFVGATINMGLNQIKNMADPTLAQDAATKFYVDSVSGPGADTYVSSFTFSGGLASTSTLDLTQTGPNAGVPFILNMGHLHSTDDDQYLILPNSDLDLYYRLFGTGGYQRVNFSLSQLNTNLTGLTNPDAYTTIITVDGGTPIYITVFPTLTYQYFSILGLGLITDLNGQLGGFAVAQLVDNDTWLTIQSKSTSSSSTIAILDAAFDVVNTGGTHIGTDLTGLTNDATVYTATVTIDGVGYPISATGSLNQTYNDLLGTINAAITVNGTAALISGNITITSATTGLTSSLLIVDTGVNPLFSSLTGFVGFTSTTTIRNIFNQLTNFTTISAAVPGFGGTLPSGYPTISLTTALTGFDTIKVTNRPTEVLASFTVNPRSTPVTPVSNLSGPTVSGSAQLLVNVPIITANSGTSEFTIGGGDFTTSLTPGVTFDINDSFIGNNGTYTILSSSFNDSSKVTTITVVETIPFSTTPGIPDGSISYEFQPVNDFDIVTKFWTDTLIARDVISADGVTVQYVLGHSLTIAGFDAGFGFQEVSFSLLGDEIDIAGADTTGLANDATVYTATVFVDGVTTPVAITGSTAQTFTTLVTQLNADISPAEAELVNGRIRISSTFAGGGSDSTIVITDSGANPLFASLNNVVFDDFRFTLSQPGLEYTKGLNRVWIFVNGIKQFLDDDFTEDGTFGSIQSSITFTYTPALSARIEFLVFKT